MNSLKLYIFILLTTCVFFGCASSSGRSVLPVELSDYTFTMYNTKSEPVAKGVMTVKNIISTGTDKATISGTYTVSDWYQDFAGKSSMMGDFSGDFDYTTNKIYINTNPRIADANVFFNLTMYSSFYEGEWRYSTFRGPTDGGRLKVVPKR